MENLGLYDDDPNMAGDGGMQPEEESPDKAGLEESGKAPEEAEQPKKKKKN